MSSIVTTTVNGVNDIAPTIPARQTAGFVAHPNSVELTTPGQGNELTHR